MGIRPCSKHVKALKQRRCTKCGCKINSQRIRCGRCAHPEPLPKKGKQSNR